MSDPTFYIYFSGLICHMGGIGNKHIAAMVRDTDHEPVVVYGAGPNDYYGIDSKAVAVKFSVDGVADTGNAKMSDTFRNCVPSLEMIMGGTPQMPIEKYAIPVFYPPGMTLTVHALYEKKAWYMRGGVKKGNPQCVARLTGMAIPAPSENSTLYVVMVDKDGKESNVNATALAPGNCLIIANRSMHPEHPVGHLKKYGAILSQEDDEVTVLQPADCTGTVDSAPHCGWVHSHAIVVEAADIECGNTNWP